MKQYLTNNIKYMNSVDGNAKRFQITRLYRDNGEWWTVLVDTYRPCKDPVDYPEFGKIYYRVLQHRYCPNRAVESELNELCKEANILYQLRYYLDQC